ncbi:endonuclease/exonuclease/phosphatase family protein, partial [candidate division KSB1 bacterium]
WNHIGNLFQIQFRSCVNVQSKHISIMSYNVNIFDIYNEWGRFDKKDKIIKLIGEKKPDILCLQEFAYHSDGGELSTIESIGDVLENHEYYVEFTFTAKKISHFGSIIFSKYPIINQGKIVFSSESGNNSQFIDIKINEDTIRIYNVHLQSIRMKPEDYRFAKDISQIKNINKQEKINKNLIGILSRIKHAFIKRAPQAEHLKDHIKNCPYPAIVCGDFNDTPSSYAYHQIIDGFIDAFVECGSGMGKTYLGVFPSFRIDYILYDPKFTAESFNTLSYKYSDHYPVFCKLQLDLENN